MSGILHGCLFRARLHAILSRRAWILPQSRSNDEEEGTADVGADYQLDMMRCLREVNVDNNTVGWCGCIRPRAHVSGVPAEELQKLHLLDCHRPRIHVAKLRL